MMRHALPVLVTILPSAALAHETGDHTQMTPVEAAQHLLTQPDHHLAFAGLAVAILAGGWLWVRAGARK